MIYGYARVSTVGQDLEAQLQALEAEGVAIVYQEKFTGTSTDRPQLNELMEQLQEGDKLVVTKLDRLARNTKEGISIIENLFERGVKVHVLNVGLLENTTMGRFFLQTLLAVAEMERNLIIERTQEGKAIAKQHADFREGRPPKYTKQQLDHAMKLLASHSFSQVAALTGISMSTLKRESKKRKAAADEKPKVQPLRIPKLKRNE